MFMTRLWKEEILENLPLKHSGAKKKIMFENIRHLVGFILFGVLCEIYFIGVLIDQFILLGFI